MNRALCMLTITVGCLGSAAPIGAQTRFQHVVTFDPGPLAGKSGSLIQATDGNLYGTTTDGAPKGDMVFRMTPAGTVTVLHTFAGGSVGGGPSAPLVQGTDGNFYGTTVHGGSSNRGTIFRMAVSGDVAILHEFAGGATDGAEPIAAMIQATDGNLYGTTKSGGASDSGTIFRMTPSGTVTLLYAFDTPGGGNRAIPGRPLSALTQATDGDFYGTTFEYLGTDESSGTIFRMSAGGTVTALANVASPALVQADDGNFYGTAIAGIISTTHLAFRMTPEGVVTGLATLPGRAGSSPLIQAADGALYGVADVPYGLIFKMTLDGTVTTLHAFLNAADGSFPSALVQASDGSFYGTMRSPNGLGNAIFRLSRALPVGDFDGDNSVDLGVFRPSTGDWSIRNSSDNSTSLVPWGFGGDLPVPGDYDGDGQTDAAVWRPSTGIWYIRNSSAPAAPSFLKWGLAGDIPIPGDYDGDGRSDAAVFRPSTGVWYIKNSSDNSTAFLQWGLSGDVPVAADYDGDEKTDAAVWRPSTGIWYIRNSSDGSASFLQWGLPGADDIPVVGDYDGDGKADAAVFRPSTGIWYVRNLLTNTASFYQWGLPGDIPVPGDYDGDGLTDVAVFRPSNGFWYVWYVGSGTYGFFQWGEDGDIPVLARP